MNFEKCGFCQKRIPKTARMDAKYCSPSCRMNALRIRKREKRLAERALAKAKEANVPDFQARQQAAKVAFLARVAGVRLAAQLPNLAEDPFLTAQAELAACRAVIAHYEKQKEALLAQLQKFPRADDMDYSSRVVKQADTLALPREATHIGVGMLSGELEGDAAIYVGTKRKREQTPGRVTRWSSGGTSYE